MSNCTDSNTSSILQKTDMAMEDVLRSVALWKRNHEEFRDNSSYRNYSRVLVKAIALADFMATYLMDHEKASLVTTLTITLEELDKDMSSRLKVIHQD